MTRLRNLSHTLLFCLVLGLMPMCYVIGVGVSDDQTFAGDEQRSRHALHFSGATSAQLRQFFSSIEPYVADRLPFRSVLLSAQAVVNRRFGRLLNSELVVLGSDGWLFFGNAVGRSLDQYRGIVQLDTQQLLRLQEYFVAIRRVADGYGVPFVVAIAPDKHSVYPEYLPRALSRKGHGPADQFVNANPPFRLIDLREVLRDEKSRVPLPLYYKTDSHWNEYGAYVAYRAILHDVPALRPLELQLADFRQEPTTGHGDLALRAGRAATFSDTLTFVRRNALPGTLRVEYPLEGRVLQHPASEEVRVSDHKRASVHSPSGRGKVLVFGDSFTDGLSRYLNNSAAEVTYQHYADFDTADVATLVQDTEPDLVLFLMVERNIHLPVSALIPLSGLTATAPPSEVNGNVTRASRLVTRDIPVASLFSESLLRHDIGNLRAADDGMRFTATGADPYFHLPVLGAMPAGAVLVIELSVPAEREVQLFYQRSGDVTMTERYSLKKALPAGRHRTTWRMDAPLNGSFRFDPGNAAGEYAIHRVELLTPEDHSATSAPASPVARVMPAETILSGESLVRGIAAIRRDAGDICFSATDADPYLHLPDIGTRPSGTSVRIVLSGPGPRMVQLYYETLAQPRMTEEQSVRASVGAGRQSVEWRIDAPLTGRLRLDPGNMPGAYCIHRIETRP